MNFKNFHHKTFWIENGRIKRCQYCGKPFHKYWKEIEAKNGFSNTAWKDKYHTSCIKKINGKPPLGLQDLNKIRQRNITKEQYYKEHGY